MENKRALFLIEQSGLVDADKQFLKTHLETYENYSRSLEGEIQTAHGRLNAISDALDGFYNEKNKFVMEIHAALAQVQNAKNLLIELAKVEQELKEVKESLDNSAKQSLAKSNEQIYYLEYKLRKAIDIVNKIDFPHIKQVI